METMSAPRSKPAEGESFAALLRRLRVAAALSQEALAERAGLSTRAVSDLERGVRQRPYLATVRLLADALQLDPDTRAALAAIAQPGDGTDFPSAVDVLPAGGVRRRMYARRSRDGADERGRVAA